MDSHLSFYRTWILLHLNDKTQIIQSPICDLSKHYLFQVSRFGPQMNLIHAAAGHVKHRKVKEDQTIREKRGGEEFLYVQLRLYYTHSYFCPIFKH